MYKKIIYSFIIIVFTATFIWGCYNQAKLGHARQQLDTIRIELERAEDKQQQLREITSRTNELLSESFDTISGIRSQIKAIRESYEEMENLLYDSGYDNNSIVNNGE